MFARREAARPDRRRVSCTTSFWLWWAHARSVWAFWTLFPLAREPKRPPAGCEDLFRLSDGSKPCCECPLVKMSYEADEIWRRKCENECTRKWNEASQKGFMADDR
ncbi:hypothetical protein B0T19DRAFT_416580 [Cercophora scortea]|uniref:Uncharacterized protein n=1 Tax=Cercophora scortea TaxID=314031 RepID=A0AAE0MHX4_9PEZI|nr:hypothetical protein B0T19DRAFT_416580 [Cercophora scortea]